MEGGGVDVALGDRLGRLGYALGRDVRARGVFLERSDSAQHLVSGWVFTTYLIR